MSTLTSFLTGIADAIRGKTGETGTISASQFAEKIAAIETGTSGGVDPKNVSARITSTSGNRRITYYAPDHDGILTVVLAANSPMDTKVNLTASQMYASDASGNDASMSIQFTSSGMMLVTIL